MAILDIVKYINDFYRREADDIIKRSIEESKKIKDSFDCSLINSKKDIESIAKDKIIKMDFKTKGIIVKYKTDKEVILKKFLVNNVYTSALKVFESFSSKKRAGVLSSLIDRLSCSNGTIIASSSDREILEFILSNKGKGLLLSDNTCDSILGFKYYSDIVEVDCTIESLLKDFVYKNESNIVDIFFSK